MNLLFSYGYGNDNLVVINVTARYANFRRRAFHFVKAFSCGFMMNAGTRTHCKLVTLSGGPARHVLTPTSVMTLAWLWPAR